jgi:hypothetical protein
MDGRRNMPEALERFEGFLEERGDQPFDRELGGAGMPSPKLDRGDVG